MTSVNPYLGCDGDCEAAFEFYRSVFGGEFEAVNRYSEMPPDAQVGSVDADKIMHISLPLADGQALMGSDRPPGMGSVTRAGVPSGSRRRVRGRLSGSSSG